MEHKLGHTIKKLRTERGITQETLAERMSVSYQAVSKWETCTTTPDIALLPRLAQFFGVSMDTLFGMDRDDHLARIGGMIRDTHTIPHENFVWAERYLKGLLADEPQNSTARTLLVELYEHRQNRDSLACGRLCEEGLRLSPSDAVLLDKLTRTRENRGESARLIRFLESLHAGRTQGHATEDALIAAYLRHGQHDRAADLLAAAPHRPMLDVYVGDLAQARGQGERAAALWRTAAESHAAQSDVLFAVAQRMEGIGEVQAALRLYEQAHRTSPAPRRTDALYAQAFLYTNIGEKQQAIQTWQRILRTLDEDHGIREGECVDWANREIQALTR